MKLNNRGPLLDGIYHHKEFEIESNNGEKQITKMIWFRFFKTGTVEAFARDSWGEMFETPLKITMINVGYNGDSGDKEKYFVGLGKWSMEEGRCFFQYNDHTLMKQFEIDMRGGDRRFIKIFPLGDPNGGKNYTYLQMKRFNQLRQRTS
jgi:hypothetical protein